MKSSLADTRVVTTFTKRIQRGVACVAVAGVSAVVGVAVCFPRDEVSNNGHCCRLE